MHSHYFAVGFLLSISILIGSCESMNKTQIGEFGKDIQFLKLHTDVFVLEDRESGAKVAVIPGMQARVMTSSAEGDAGVSFGWINRQLVIGKTKQPHINVFGGEDRFWLGPEGGQFSIFFKKGDPFDLEHWQTPEPIDWGAWDMVTKEENQAQFRKTFSLTNYSNFQFNIFAERNIRILNRDKIEKDLGIKIGTAIKFVGYETDNIIGNTGSIAWEKDTGLISIWILGMFKHSPQTTVLIPYKKDSNRQPDRIVNDTYFGKVPEDRLKIDREKGLVFFKGDGLYRSKIGLSPLRAKNMMGSYDADKNILTVVQFSFDENAIDYVNSMWEIQSDPYSGDVINSYNDGPPEPGKKALGPFYELESSSKAARLEPGEKLRHIHQTFHFMGEKTAVNDISQDLFGVSLTEIELVF